MSNDKTLPAVAAHGAMRLPGVVVDAYNLEIKDNQGFIGDRANKGAFRDMIEQIRKSLRRTGDDPLGDEESDELSKAQLDAMLSQGEPEAAGIVQGRSRFLSGVCRGYKPVLDPQRMERHRAYRHWRGFRVAESVSWSLAGRSFY